MRQARRDKGSLQWAKACIAADLRGDGATLLLAEVVRGRVRATPVTVEDEAFRSARTRGIPVVAALPVRRSFIRWLETPLASTTKALKVLPSVLDIQLPFPLEECVYTFLAPRQTVEATTRSLAVAARCRDAEERLSELGGLGLDPAALDHEGLALWTQALEAFPPESGSRQPRAVLRVDREDAVLVLGRGVELVAAHGVSPDNTGQIARLLMAHLGAAETDDAGGGERMEWIWCGGVAADQDALARVREPVERLRPGASRVVDAPALFLARALATRALLPGRMHCNLRSGRLVHAATRQRGRASSLRAAVAVMLSGLALCVVSMALVAMCAKATAHADESFATLRDRLLGYPLAVKGEDALNRVSTKLDLDAARYHPFVNAFRPSLTRTLTALMGTARENDLRFKLLSLEREQAIISGTAADWDACDRLVEALASGGYAVKLERKDVLEDERVPFTIEPEVTHD